MNTNDKPFGSRLSSASSGILSFPDGEQTTSSPHYTQGTQSVKSAVSAALERARAVSAQGVAQEQLRFFRENETGCSFAALAARDPSKYGWHRVVIEPNASWIDVAIAEAVADPDTSTLSLIIPSITTSEELWEFLLELQQSRFIFVGLDEVIGADRCIGLRARVGEYQSWISGFGNFPSMPITRRAPFVELVLRTKPRPNYSVILKEAPAMVIHLADMHLRGITREAFAALWQSSLRRTAAILGHAPDLRSAAKTSFVFPVA